MPEHQPDAWVRAYIEDVFNGHNLQSLDKYMTEDIVSHWLGDRSLDGREAWKKAMANFFEAFPDASYTWMTSSSRATESGELGMRPSERSGREFQQAAAKRSWIVI